MGKLAVKRLNLLGCRRAVEATLFALGVASSIGVGAEDSRSQRSFGGPDPVENRIAADAQPMSALIKERVTDPWFEWKKGLQPVRFCKSPIAVPI
jgi:hypothetical protein